MCTTQVRAVKIFFAWLVCLLCVHGYGVTCRQLFEAIETGDALLVFRYGLHNETPLGQCRDETGHNAMHYFAQFSKNDQIFSSLNFMVRADINAVGDGGETPLMIAAQTNNLVAIKSFIFTSAQRVQIDAFDAHGNTALHHAARAGNRNAIAMLIKYGARKDILNADQKPYTALWLHEAKTRTTPTAANNTAVAPHSTPFSLLPPKGLLFRDGTYGIN